MASNTVYLITGANRGIGHGIVASYLEKPNNTVIATVRDATNRALTKDLSSLPTGESSKLIIFSLEATHESEYNELLRKITSEYGTDHIDVVIANAGINYDMDPVATTSIAKMKEYMEVNAYGPLLLFQAVLPLLEKSATPKFVGMGSLISSLGNLERCPIPMTPYATSKIVVHWLSRKIHFEHNNIISFVVDPGYAISNHSSWR
jgi:norsolorinic acid ketoreductase